MHAWINQGRLKAEVSFIFKFLQETLRISAGHLARSWELKFGVKSRLRKEQQW